MVLYRITIEEVEATEPSAIVAGQTQPVVRKIYEQTVPGLDLQAVINVVNKKKRAPRKRKAWLKNGGTGAEA